MANPFPFVAGSVLLASELNGIGEATAYTPTTTNVTLGNGTLTGVFVRVQKFVYAEIDLLFGSTTSLGGSPTFTLPVTATAGAFAINGVTDILDAGNTIFLGGVQLTTTTAQPFVSVASSTYLFTPTANISATVPMTWANTDRLQIKFVYQAA